MPELFFNSRAARKNHINSTLALGQMMANTPGQVRFSLFPLPQRPNRAIVTFENVIIIPAKSESNTLLINDYLFKYKNAQNRYKCKQFLKTDENPCKIDQQ